MSLIGLIAALSMLAPPPEPNPSLALTSTQLITQAKLNDKGTMIIWEAPVTDGRALRQHSIRFKWRRRIPPLDKPQRSYQSVRTLKKRLVNVLTDSDRWAIWVGGKEPTAPSAASDLHPALSPNSKTIAFVSGRSGLGDIYLANARKTNQSPRQVTHTPEPELYPAWSPNSRQLAFLRVTARGQVIVILSGLGPKGIVRQQVAVTRQFNPLRPTWSPDGKYLAFYSRDWSVGSALYIVSSSGGAPKKVATGIMVQRQGPTWIPASGKSPMKLVFVQDTDQVVIIDTASMQKSVLKTPTFGHGEVTFGRLGKAPVLLLTALGARGTKTTATSAVLNNRQLYIWRL
jgi:Tol biopolymer transport system component